MRLLSRLTLVHALEDSDEIDLALNTEVDISRLLFGETDTLTTAFDVYDLLIAEYSTEENLIEREEIIFASASHYLLIATGNTDNASLLIIETASDTIANLQGSTTVSSAPRNSDVREGTIVNVLDQEDDFTVLIAAIQAADESLINILGNPNAAPVTFLAPNDRAFQNLLATSGYSQARLLADTELLTTILRYHIIEEELFESDFSCCIGHKFSHLA